MRYVFRNPSSPKSSLSFISFDSILQFFSVNIALTSPTISCLLCTAQKIDITQISSHERMGHLLLIAVVHLLNPLYVDAFSVRDLLLSLNTCTMYLDLEIAVEVRTSTKKKPMPIQFVHTRLCKKSRQEHLDLIQKFFSICEN